MKTLLLLRHAKSSWDYPELDDHDRPLAPRGFTDAPRMGRLLGIEDLEPDLILTSDAVRARGTAQQVWEELGGDADVVILPDLYHGDVPSYIAAIAEHGGETERLLVVGHNPGISELVMELTGRHELLPTAGLACVELDVEEWHDVETSPPGHLEALWRPKELPPE
ncbi:MAG: histidine phosphatase family protein [Gemmatimonadetes bacterium]|nr:histidine phosphatase family protein [Gemmatimonadota bacterium]